MSKFQIIKDSGSNLFSFKTKLFYIVEPNDWSTRWDGIYITESLNSQKLINSKISTSRFFLRNKIVHFGSLGTFINYTGIKSINSTNKVVFTWFHIPDNDMRIKYIPELNKKTDFVHTSCEITKNQLINFGLNPDKIQVVPIGIDLKTFQKFDENKKLKLKFQIPNNKIIIGSFQKDGAGWGEGLEPKLIKGPDIFCDVVEKLAKKHKIHILLTGPSRGYVKNKLQKANISFSHFYIDNFLEIVDYYNVLDLYIVTSRAEGGPKAITESLATGVPIVSTKVGIAPEIITSGENGFLCEIDDTENLIKKSCEIIENIELRTKFIDNGLEAVKNLSWEITTKQLYDKIYSKLL